VPDTLEDDRFKTNRLVVGAPHIRFYAGAQLRSAQGHPIGTLCVMDTQPRTFDARQLTMLRDLAGVVTSELELRMIATQDATTGSLSRRAFRDEANRAIALAARHRHSLSCIVFDLDFFKRVNDEYGHAVGDIVLARSAEACRLQLRKSDLLGRIGGEEFAVLLPHTDRTAAAAVAEKIRQAIEASMFDDFPGLRISASFGVAGFELSILDVGELLDRADKALYAAKAAGRNRCVEWQPTTASMSGMRRVLKAGQIAFNAGRSTIDCTVRGLSGAGASIDVASTAGIPPTFKLQIEADGLSRRCRVSTKNEKRLEIQFE
jgi:diguanylate cyclase (GGDEF)-like protein